MCRDKKKPEDRTDAGQNILNYLTDILSAYTKDMININI